MAPADTLQVEVAYCASPGGVADVVLLQLLAGALLSDALGASGVLERHGLSAPDLRVGGRRCKSRDLTTVLRDRDRVEIYRPLTVDPKEARRQRYKRDKAKKAVAPA